MAKDEEEHPLQEESSESSDEGQAKVKEQDSSVKEEAKQSETD